MVRKKKYSVLDRLRKSFREKFDEKELFIHPDTWIVRFTHLNTIRTVGRGVVERFGKSHHVTYGINLIKKALTSSLGMGKPVVAFIQDGDLMMIYDNLENERGEHECVVISRLDTYDPHLMHEDDGNGSSCFVCNRPFQPEEEIIHISHVEVKGPQLKYRKDSIAFVHKDCIEIKVPVSKEIEIALAEAW